jgi:hypothetical protein
VPEADCLDGVYGAHRVDGADARAVELARLLAGHVWPRLDLSVHPSGVGGSGDRLSEGQAEHAATVLVERIVAAEQLVA